MWSNSMWSISVLLRFWKGMVCLRQLLSSRILRYARVYPLIYGSWMINCFLEALSLSPDKAHCPIWKSQWLNQKTFRYIYGLILHALFTAWCWPNQGAVCQIDTNCWTEVSISSPCDSIIIMSFIGASYMKSINTSYLFSWRQFFLAFMHKTLITPFSNIEICCHFRFFFLVFFYSHDLDEFCPCWKITLNSKVSWSMLQGRTFQFAHHFAKCLAFQTFCSVPMRFCMVIFISSVEYYFTICTLCTCVAPCMFVM